MAAFQWFTDLLVKGGRLQGDQVNLNGQSNAETEAFSIKAIFGLGIQMAQSWIVTTSGALYNQGNGQVKSDGDLTVQGNGKTLFLGSAGISVNRGTNAARAGVDIGSTAYIEGNTTIAGALTTNAAPLTYNPAGKKVITGTTLESVLTSIDNSLVSTIARSTGIISGGAVSMNTNTARFDVAAGTGAILNLSNPAAPVATLVSWTAQTAVLPASAAGSASYVYFDANGAIQQLTAKPSNSQMRLLGVFVGRVQTNASGVIVATQGMSDPIQATANLIGDLATGIGVFVQNGARVSGTANLGFALSAGALYDHGGFFQAQPTDPSTANIAAANPKGFRYLTQSGASTGSDITALDPAKYDNAGTITTVPAGGLGVTRVTNQRVYLYPSGNVRVQYGQKFYESMGDATAALATEAFTVNPNQVGNSVMVAILTMQVTATATNDVTKVIITPASRFGEIGGASSSTTNTNTMQSITGSNGVSATTSGNATTVSGVAATASAVGVVKPGGGLAVAADGTLSVSALTVATTLAELAAATTRRVDYDGSIWLRVTGNVDSNVGNNPKYTALQYNAGADRYERQYSGYAMFSWWKNSAPETYNQLRYAINHTAGAKIQVEDGTYTFTSFAWTPGNFELRGNLVDPGRVRFVVSGGTDVEGNIHTRVLRGWYFYDGTAGQRFENIRIEGITFVQNSSATVNATTNVSTGSYGPIALDGGSHNNIVIRRCYYEQQSTTAITNFFYIKPAPNQIPQNITIEENYSVNSATKGRMMGEIINQDHPNNDKGLGRNIKIRRNYIDGFDYGFSVAGNFTNTVIDDNDVGNCTSYGVEFAGSNTNAVLSNSRFFGTHNVLWASNYHGETNGATGDYAIPAGSGQHFINNRTVGYVPGIVEVRGGGDMVFNGNQLNISGGVFLRRNSLGGVVSGEMKNNRITTNATATNMSNKAVVFLAGATNLRASNNTFERTSTDTVPLIQAVKSNDETYGTGSVLATGTNSTGSLFEGNVLIAGATPTSYFSAPDANSMTILRNITGTGAMAI